MGGRRWPSSRRPVKILALCMVLAISSLLVIRYLAAGPTPLYLGLDLSTQSLKCTVLSSTLTVVLTESVEFSKELPTYHTEHGAHHAHDEGSQPGTVTSPVLMWVEALDLLLQKLAAAQFDFSAVKAVSANGQQHGTVYWSHSAAHSLQSLDSKLALAPQLHRAFAVEDSPIWMDSSTSAECARREAAAGGAIQLAELTGSRAYPRFSANQIAKIGATVGGLASVERISLVSSFVASLLASKYVGIDSSDAGGMNLMDLRRKVWDPTLLKVTSESNRGIAAMLGDIVNPHDVVGPISSYLHQRYGFNPSCSVVASSGDNPCTLAGLGLSEPGDVAISLGTSDTLFAVTRHPRPGLEGRMHNSLRNP